ncbi:hypothetical protein J4573_26835 [Actinomadura barringtoniae]|uniref:UVR domain-containing protein n=1 Tax=Actinomadura barringtoniae TaxID=1427535 RepID=A0A939PEB4_9ACTN|nr:hypothetical protein [Actinomadura barringtoniae]MBO2450748.1 hypothetical protein [Actinomadura barringtoniae]
MWQAKDDAIEAQDYARAAELRDEEKATLRRAVSELDEQLARTQFAAAIDAVMKLQAEVGRLGGLLQHWHGADAW